MNRESPSEYFRGLRTLIVLIVVANILVYGVLAYLVFR